MAKVLSPNEIMFTPFEPKTQNRFLVMGLGDVPAFLIKTAGRPNITFETITIDHINTKHYYKGKGEWNTLDVTLYDPVVTSAAQAVMDWIRLAHESITGVDGYKELYQKEVTINVLDPMGNGIEEWKLVNAWIKDANFNTLDWSSNEPVDIALTLQYDYAVLEY